MILGLEGVPHQLSFSCVTKMRTLEEPHAECGAMYSQETRSKGNLCVCIFKKPVPEGPHLLQSVLHVLRTGYGHEHVEQGVL